MAREGEWSHVGPEIPEVERERARQRASFLGARGRVAGPVTLAGFDQDGAPLGELQLTLRAGILEYVILTATPSALPD